MKMVLRMLLMLLAILPIRAQTLGNGNIWHYQLTEGAAIMDDCPSCDRVSIWEPLAGSFDLVGTAAAGEFIVTNISFHTTSGVDRSIIGGGTLDFAAGDAVLTLDVSIFVLDGSQRIHMTNAPPEGPRIFPMIGAQANEDPGSIYRVYRLRIEAAPIRELWFSTVTNFSSGRLGATVSQGDLISASGRIVKRNSELTELLSIPDGDVGLDAVSVGPRGEVFFSITTNVESLVNGPISEGDVVTSAGRIYEQNAQLLSAFQVDTANAGLDGIQFVGLNEIYFSITNDVPRPGAATLRRGDILSTKGRIIRTESALFVRWVSPLTAPIGVDAFYVWPNNEIWFSPETNFTADDGTVISAGDLISDQGYIVYRNVDLVSAFRPADRAVDVGLDGFVVISDATASTGSTLIGAVTPTDIGVDVDWETASARIFQLERAASVTGPWTPITELTLDHSAHDAFFGTTAFYRVRQW